MKVSEEGESVCFKNDGHFQTWSVEVYFMTKSSITQFDATHIGKDWEKRCKQNGQLPHGENGIS